MARDSRCHGLFFDLSFLFFFFSDQKGTLPVFFFHRAYVCVCCWASFSGRPPRGRARKTLPAVSSPWEKNWCVKKAPPKNGSKLTAHNRDFKRKMARCKKKRGRINKRPSTCAHKHAHTHDSHHHKSTAATGLGAPRGLAAGKDRLTRGKATPKAHDTPQAPHRSWHPCFFFFFHSHPCTQPLAVPPSPTNQLSP
nr:hypothetical protein [Pandoravirus aubagnensis]